MALRDYQKEIVKSTLSEKGNVLIQADTGAGKTRILAAIAKKHTHVLLVAHRNALVTQLSLEFAKSGLYHNTLCAKTTRRRAELLHRRHIGKCMLSKTASRFVCSVDTIISKEKNGTLEINNGENWLIIVDEAHHMVEKNKWGKLCEIFRNAKVVGATATPCRLDGVSLKKGYGGVFDVLVQAESLKKDSVSKLIQKGFISPFKCFASECPIDEAELTIFSNDYTAHSQIKMAKKYFQLMSGDAVSYYKKLANGKQAVAFCVSIELAERTAQVFRKAGIASAAIHSKMGRTEVDKVFDMFESKQVQVLCNVDMTGEGVDIPAIEVLIMLRKTASLALYRQWIGRSLRPCSGKELAIIIDHADNVRKFGLPDEHVEWSLERPPKQQKSNLIRCPFCSFLIKAWSLDCPECGKGLRTGLGMSPKDIKYVDLKLVEIYRTKIEQETRDNVVASSISTDEIRYLHKKEGKMGGVETKVALWFFENIKNNVTRKQAEDFFLMNNNIEFWSKHFTLAELNKLNEKKCMRIFNESTRNK